MAVTAVYIPWFEGHWYILLCSGLAFVVAFDLWELAVLLAALLVHALFNRKCGAKKISWERRRNHSCGPNNFAPTFKGQSWDDQVQEALEARSPTPAVHVGVNKLADYLQSVLKRSFPGVKVQGFARGNPFAVQAYRAALPEIQMTIMVDLVDHFSSTLSDPFHETSPGKLNKHILRSTMRQLVYKHGFKFRRTALGGESPKAVLTVPPTLRFFDEAVCVEISVNSMEPAHASELLDFGHQATPFTNQLVMLVQHWARDRGISYVAEGSLSPFAWTVLVLFFMQTRGLLPSFQQNTHQDTAAHSGMEPAASAGALVKDFFRFYAEECDLFTEVVCIRTGQRCKRIPPLPPADVRLVEEELAEAIPRIKDPFNAAIDLESGMLAKAIVRLKEELTRASTLCCQGAPLAEVFALFNHSDESSNLEGQDLGFQ